jgi:hypothetical protein
MLQVNKVKIVFTKRQMTAYGGFTLPEKEGNGESPASFCR